MIPDFESIGKKITLHEMSNSDIPYFISMFSDEDGAFLSGVSVPRSVSVVASYLEKLRDQHFTSRLMGMYDNSKGTLVGVCSLKQTDEVGQNYRIGYFVSNHCRTKGFAGETVELLLDIAFNLCNAKSVEAYCRIENIISKNILLHRGFTEVKNITSIQEEKISCFCITEETHRNVIRGLHNDRADI